MAGPLDQLGGVDMAMLVCLVGMNADGRPDVRLALSGGEYRIPLAFARRDVEHCGDPTGTGAFEYRLLFFDQALVIEVAMAVGEHQATAGRSRRGKAGMGAAMRKPLAAWRAYQPSSSIAA